MPERSSTIAPHVEIYAAEPEQADDAYRSFKAGHIIADDAPVTVADGLKGAAEGAHLAFRLAPCHRHSHRVGKTRSSRR